MTDDTANLILEHLRLIRGDVGALKIKVDEIASTQSAMLQILANQGSRLDRVEKRLEQIETRLGLVDA